MARLFVYDFAAPGTGNLPRALVKFYSDSGATTPVPVYGSEYATSPLGEVRANGQGKVTADLWVDSSVAALYARTENPYTATSATVQVPLSDLSTTGGGLPVVDGGSA